MEICYLYFIFNTVLARRSGIFDAFQKHKPNLNSVSSEMKSNFEFYQCIFLTLFVLLQCVPI